MRVEGAEEFEMGQEEAGVEFELSIGGFHVFAELIEGLVVVLLLEVCQFVHHDHLQKFKGCDLEGRGDSDLVLGLEFGALYPGDKIMYPEGVVEDFNLSVVADFAQRWRLPQKLVLARHGEIVERLVGADVVRRRVLLQQDLAQAIFGDELRHLVGQLGRIAGQIFQTGLHARQLPSFTVSMSRKDRIDKLG